MDEPIRHRFVIKLFNGEENDQNTRLPVAMAAVDEPDAGSWATEEMGSIGGVRWESDGTDFAFAVLVNEPGLIAKLENEGYILDATEFVEAKS